MYAIRSYYDGEIYLNATNVNVPVNFSFTDTGIYSIEVVVIDINGYNTFTRITSYNVCYTKLLRKIFLLKSSNSLLMVK